MQRKIFNSFFYLAFLSSLAYSCSDDTIFAEAPEVEIVGMSKNTLEQSFIPDSDSILFTLKFRDGDGDFGSNATDTSKVYFIDSRTDFEYSFVLPNVMASGTRGIEGEITVKTGAVCCIFPDGDIPCTPRSDYPVDTMNYKIYLVDLGGRSSDTLISEDIYISCD